MTVWSATTVCKKVKMYSMMVIWKKRSLVSAARTAMPRKTLNLLPNWIIPKEVSCRPITNNAFPATGQRETRKVLVPAMDAIKNSRAQSFLFGDTSR